MLAEKAHYPIRAMARVLGVTPSGYLPGGADR